MRSWKISEEGLEELWQYLRWHSGGDAPALNEMVEDLERNGIVVEVPGGSKEDGETTK